MMECIFCKIVNNEMPSETVFEDKDVKAFKDIHPKAPVHIVVIPKIHIQSIAHLESDHNDVIVKLLYTAKDIAGDLGLKGYKLLFNVGREGGQVVDHLHMHLLSGWGAAEADVRKV